MAGMGGKPAKAQTVTVALSGMSRCLTCNKCFGCGGGFAILCRPWCRFVLCSCLPDHPQVWGAWIPCETN